MVFYDNGVLGLRERRKRLGVFVFAVLFTVLLGTGTAWAAAYTLTNNAGSACVTKTCTMSAIIADSTHSNWTGTSTFGFMPGNGNTVTIPDGYHLTIDQNWTIGASTANNTTSSIYMSKTGIVEVRSGVTLRARGDLLYDVTAASSTALLLDAGSALIFDSSQAASPTTTRYRFGGDGNGYAIRFLFANGTPSSHVTVTSDLTNGALPGQFRSSPVGNGGSQYGGSLTATYTDFSYIGDGTATGQAWQIADPNFGFGFPYFSLQHCTIDHSGPNFQGSGIGTDATFILNYDTFTNSLGSTNIGVGSGGSVGGKYQVTNNVFDKAWGGGTGGCSGGAPQVGGTFSNNFFGGSMCYDPSSTVTDSFIRGLGTPWLIKGDLTNGYYADDVTNHDNPHWSQYDSTRPITVSGFIFDDPDNISADSGEMWTEGTTPTPMVEGFNNNIELPTKTGSSNSELMASTNVVPNATTTIINMLHNTWVGGTQFGMVQMNEGGASKDPVAAVESNLAWSNSGGYSKVSTVQTAAMLTNSVTLADYNSADSHLTQTITCPSCTNQGNGYIGV